MPAYITPGETFADGQSVSGTRLNNHVAALTILPSFVSSQPSGVAPDLLDRALIYDISGSGALISPTISDILALLAVDAAAGVGSLRTLGTTGNKAAQGSLTPQLAFSNIFTGALQSVPHLKGNVVTTSASVLAGAGSGATINLAAGSNDMIGQINLTTGTGTTASTNQCTLSFGVQWGTAPFVLIQPYNTAAWSAQQTNSKFLRVIAVDVNQFTLISGTTPLSASTAYVFSYICIGG